MAKTFRIPGVYIEEKSAFPNAIMEAPTAIPAFIGYTEKAERDGKLLTNVPTRITSLEDYIASFGRGFSSMFTLSRKRTSTTHKTQEIIINGQDHVLSYKEQNEALLYRSIQFFYANGGGACYIVSVGNYGDQETIAIDKKQLIGTTQNEGLQTLTKEQEPTIIVVPDAVLLPVSDCYEVYKSVLAHCAHMQSRIAICDVHNGFAGHTMDQGTSAIAIFRNLIGAEFLSYGVAYYPWLETSIVSKDQFTFKNLDPTIDLASIFTDTETDAKELWEQYIAIGNDDNLHFSLLASSPTYTDLIAAMTTLENLLPPVAAMAGIYTVVDNTRGVWKTPANINVNSVVKPSLNITHEEQEMLNADVYGKSINAIRSFSGEGTLVWGARTLDGNSLDWRYINVRRTLIMIEQSIKRALQGYVFEANDANTWTSVKNMITGFLTQKWKQGALAGAVPEDAFNVLVGLGSTMTSVDILEDRMLVCIKLAIVRPAEFIVITLEQQMQKA